MGFDHSDETGDKETEPTPKLGVEYRATDRLTLRAAAFRTVKSNIIAQQTIEPTTVAGFNQVFDDFNGTKADQAGIGADYRLTQDVTVGAQSVYRDLSLPRLDDNSFITRDADEATAHGYLYWTATDRVAFTMELRGSRFRQHRSDSAGQPSAIDAVLAPVSVRYFDPSGFFAVGGVQYVGQSVTAVSGSTEDESWGDSWLLDAAIGYRLPTRRGIVSLELNNILDQNVHWQDDSFRSSEQQNRRFIPERSAMVRLNLNF